MFEDLKPQPNKNSVSRQLGGQASIKYQAGAEEAPKKEPAAAKLRQGEPEDIFSGADANKDKPFLNEVDKEEKRKKEEMAEEKPSGNKKKIIFISISITAVILIIVFFVVLNKFNFLNFTGEAPVAEKEQTPAEKLEETGEHTPNPSQEGNLQEQVDSFPSIRGGRGVLEIIDTDGDGLTDDEEVKLGTSSANVDTDGDGLSDREEINVYKTDPLNPDTDNDGYSDGVEVNGGYNPKGEGKLFGN